MTYFLTGFFLVLGVACGLVAIVSIYVLIAMVIDVFLSGKKP